jgi:hypothetical protein
LQFLKNDEVSIVNVPRIPEFQSKQLEMDAVNDKLLQRFIPESKLKRPLPRQYLYNVINSIKPEFFPSNILHAMKRRSDGATDSKQEKIQIRQEFLSFFNTKAFTSSSKKGRAVAMMKPAKTLDQMELQLKARMMNDRK